MVDDEGRKSIFNAGVAQTERVDEIQREINRAWFNPLQKHMETGMWNFQIIIAGYDRIFDGETWAKLPDNLKEKGIAIQSVVHDFIKLNPIITEQKNGTLKINRENYENLIDRLRVWQRIIKVILDKVEFDSPNKDEDSYGW